MAEKHLKNTKKTREEHVEEKGEIKKGKRIKGERRRELDRSSSLEDRVFPNYKKLEFEWST